MLGVRRGRVKHTACGSRCQDVYLQFQTVLELQYSNILYKFHYSFSPIVTYLLSHFKVVAHNVTVGAQAESYSREERGSIPS